MAIICGNCNQGLEECGCILVLRTEENLKNLTMNKPTKLKSAEEIAIWNGCDNHPELEEVIKAMNENSNQLLREVIEEIEKEKYNQLSGALPAYNNYDNGLERAIKILKSKLKK